MICFRGDFIFISSSSAQLKFTLVKKAWVFISSNPLYPRRSLGSNFKMEFMKSLSSSLRLGFFHTRLVSACLTTRFTLSFSLMSAEAKGGQQLDISQAQTPIAQMSISFWQPSLRTISGAQQMVVPASVLLSSSSCIYLARPKSVSFAQPFSKIRTFSGFKSLYMMFFEWRYSIPKMRQPSIKRTASSPAFLKSLRRGEAQLISVQVSPPGAHSITKYKQCSSLNAQYKVVMNLLLDSCNIFFYSLMFAVSFFLQISFLMTLLMAYFSLMPLALFSFSSARKTSPKPPLPILPMISKLSHLTALGAGYIFSITSATSSIFCTWELEIAALVFGRIGGLLMPVVGGLLVVGLVFILLALLRGVDLLFEGAFWGSLFWIFSLIGLGFGSGLFYVLQLCRSVELEGVGLGIDGSC